MWKCEQCGESIEDQFDSCWNCVPGESSARTDPDSPPPVYQETDYSDWSFWFSPKGRINRWPYFVVCVLAAGLTVVTELIPENRPLLIWSGLLVGLISFYVSMVLAIKRSHDRGKSGFFVVLFFIPFLNLWPLIELTFFRGDDSRNIYGDNPLQPVDLAETARTQRLRSV